MEHTKSVLELAWKVGEELKLNEEGKDVGEKLRALNERLMDFQSGRNVIAEGGKENHDDIVGGYKEMMALDFVLLSIIIEMRERGEFDDLMGDMATSRMRACLTMSEQTFSQYMTSRPPTVDGKPL